MTNSDRRSLAFQAGTAPTTETLPGRTPASPEPTPQAPAPRRRVRALLRSRYRGDHLLTGHLLTVSSMLTAAVGVASIACAEQRMRIEIGVYAAVFVLVVGLTAVLVA
jgi:hypothetical protein